MSNQAPQLDRGEMAAAENANIKAAEDIMRLLSKALRDHADQYPPKLRKSLSDPKAETNIEVSFNGKSVYSARLDKDQKHKEPPVNQMTETQASFLKEALSKQKGESFDSPEIRNMRVFVNGEKLFELKEGKVLQNDLPLEFSKTLSDMMQPKPLDLAISNFTQKLQESYTQPETEKTQQKSPAAPAPAAQPKPTAQAQRSPQPEPAKAANVQQPQPASQPQPSGQPQQGAPATASVQPNQGATQPSQQPVSPPAAKPEVPKAESAKPQQASAPIPQAESTPKGLIPPDYGVEAAKGITWEKLQASGDQTLMRSYGSLENIRAELNDSRERASAPGFEWIAKAPHLAPLEQRLSEEIPVFEAKLNQSIKDGKYPSPGAAVETQSPTPETKTIPGLDQSLNSGQWVPTGHQDELNRKLITQARAAIELGCSEQPRGNRQMDVSTFSIRETPDSISVRLKDTNTSIEQKGDTITGQARQTDIDGLKKANIAMKAIDNDRSHSSEMEMGD